MNRLKAVLNKYAGRAATMILLSSGTVGAAYVLWRLFKKALALIISVFNLY